jgi:hypothetical protein
MKKRERILSNIYFPGFGKDCVCGCVIPRMNPYPILLVVLNQF